MLKLRIVEHCLQIQYSFFKLECHAFYMHAAYDALSTINSQQSTEKLTIVQGMINFNAFFLKKTKKVHACT